MKSHGRIASVGVLVAITASLLSAGIARADGYLVASCDFANGFGRTSNDIPTLSPGGGTFSFSGYGDCVVVHNGAVTSYDSNLGNGIEFSASGSYTSMICGVGSASGTMTLTTVSGTEIGSAAIDVDYAAGAGGGEAVGYGEGPYAGHNVTGEGLLDLVVVPPSDASCGTGFDVSGAFVIQDDPAPYATQEATCVQSQVVDPNPSSDAICNDLGQVVAKVDSEASCIQGQLSNPDPANGDIACSTVGSVAGQAKGVISLAEREVAAAQQEAACIQGQATSPNPPATDPLGTGVCGDVRGGVQVADQELADAQCAVGQTGSNPPPPGSGQTLCQTVRQVKPPPPGSCAPGQAGVPPACVSPPPPPGPCPAGQVGAGSTCETVPSLGQPTACASQAASPVANGYIGGAFLGLWTGQPSPGETKVCVQLADGQNQYGVLDVAQPSGSASPPSQDANGSACLQSGGSKLFDDGTLLGEITISDYFSGSTNAQWVCLQAPDGVSVRVIVPESAPGVSGAPTVGTVSSPPAPPTPTPWPSVPSGRCTASGNGFLLADYDVQGTQLWLADNTSSSSNLEVCAREQSASGAGEGGTVDVSTSSAANQLPQLGVSPDVSPCTVPVNDLNDPLYLHVDASPPNSNQPLPQSLCVSTAPGSGTRLTLAPAPGGGQPVFSSDPGTP